MSLKSDAIECSLSFAPKSRCLLSQWLEDWLPVLSREFEAVQHAMMANEEAIKKMRLW